MAIFFLRVLCVLRRCFVEFLCVYFMRSSVLLVAMSDCPLVLRRLLLVVTLLSNQCTGQSAHSSGAKVQRRFEYKYSFKGPHLVQPDGTIPFWDHYGGEESADLRQDP